MLLEVSTALIETTLLQLPIIMRNLITRKLLTNLDIDQFYANMEIHFMYHFKTRSAWTDESISVHVDKCSLVKKVVKRYKLDFLRTECKH